MDERIKELLSRGREHYQKREFDKADYLLREVVEHSDRFADVFDMLGIIAHSRGDLAGGPTLFERAVTLNPAYTEALLNLAVTLNDLGELRRCAPNPRQGSQARNVRLRYRSILSPAARSPTCTPISGRRTPRRASARSDRAVPEGGLTLPDVRRSYARASATSIATPATQHAREQYQAAKDANPRFMHWRACCSE